NWTQIVELFYRFNSHPKPGQLVASQDVAAYMVEESCGVESEVSETESKLAESEPTTSAVEPGVEGLVLGLALAVLSPRALRNRTKSPGETHVGPRYVSGRTN